MDTSTQRRARKGGETGANGEWYEGGKFIATTDRAKANKVWKKPTGRQQVERGNWTTPPELPGNLYAVALFPSWAGIHPASADWLTFTPNHGYMNAIGMAHDPRIDAFNAGKRWAIWDRLDDGSRVFTGDYL